MNVFDTEYFPTPDSLIGKMIAPFHEQLTKRTILEPSAGSGSILDYIQRSLSWNKRRPLYCCEVNPELVYTLQGKGYKVVAEDFLTFEPMHDFDLVIMNPPFSNGDEHLLKAWDILNGGDIVCLLNAETIRNPYTAKRKLLASIIEKNGSVEFIGRPFATASRKTNVEVALVRLHKERTDNTWKINFDGKKDAEVDFAEAINNRTDLATNDQIGAYVDAWHNATEAVKDFIKAKAKMQFYTNAFMSPETTDKIITKLWSNKEEHAEDNMKNAYHTWLNEAKSEAWRKIISQLGMDKYMTSSLTKSFDDFCNAQGCYEINKENIFKLFDFVAMNIKTIMDKAVSDLFDKFTMYDKKNTNHTEGWKTNSAFKVNKRVILPAFVSCEYSNYYHTNYHRTSEYNDIEKVMCYLSGFPYENLIHYNPYKCQEYTEEDWQNMHLEDLINQVAVGDQSWNDSKFFRFRCFKKGTLHIEFKDERLWAAFNLAVCKGKNMIGE